MTNQMSVESGKQCRLSTDQWTANRWHCQKPNNKQTIRTVKNKRFILGFFILFIGKALKIHANEPLNILTNEPLNIHTNEQLNTHTNEPLNIHHSTDELINIHTNKPIDIHTNEPINTT